MPLVAEDIKQVKSIVLETFQEHFEHSVQPSPAPPKSESERKWDLLERIVRVEEELKYLREDMERRFAEAQEDRKQLREDMERRFAEAQEDRKQLREDMERRFTEAREDMERRFTEVNRRFAEMREDMNRRFAEVREDIERNFKFTVWVVSGWGTLLAALISLFSLLS